MAGPAAPDALGPRSAASRRSKPCSFRKISWIAGSNETSLMFFVQMLAD
jgi:hypothetical protein